MKRCPDCRRDYYDDTLSFCLEDGAELLHGVNEEGPSTAILHQTAAPSEGAMRAQIHNTEQATAVFTADLPRPEVGKRPFDKRLLAAPILMAAIVFGGFGAYRYFKPVEASSISSIAVLPFESRGSDTDTEYLTDGLAESLIYRLSQIPDLKVSPRTSVFRYKGRDADAEKVGEELGVDAVMSGRLVQRGENLTISVDLIDVRNKKTLWGEKFERKMSELLATQREIAAAIAERLQLRISPAGQKGIAKRYTDSSEAYQHYLRGRHYWNKRTKAAIEQGIEHFQKAIDLDPKFALAHVGIADSYFVMPSYAYISPKEGMPKAIAAAKRALEIDPDLAQAHATYGSGLTYEYRWAEAEAEIKRSIELDPSSAESHYRYSLEYLAPVGRIDEAIREINLALELEPLSIPISANLAGLYIHKRNNAAALEHALKVYQLEPGHATATFWLGWAYVANEKHAEAIALCEKTLASDPENQDPMQILAYAHAKAGSPDETRRIIAKFEELGKRKYVVAYRVATLYGVLGDKDRAFAELEKSLEARDWDFNRLKIDTFVDPLRDDPRFGALLARLTLPN